jgi:hypothetical protein
VPISALQHIIQCFFANAYFASQANRLGGRYPISRGDGAESVYQLTQSTLAAPARASFTLRFALLAHGAVFGARNLALRGHARRLAKNAGVTAEEAAKEFTANIMPGITVIPSGVWGLNRAREAGCTYCASR